MKQSETTIGEDFRLINNRQGGRRRGRGGGGRAPNMSAGGNRQDNRQRGNAAQLLEKYKGLARDAQMQGDRVQTEFYLQFADHYFRVLNESRVRFEEQRRQRGDYDSSYDDDDQDENEGGRDNAEAQSDGENEAREAEAPREGRKAGNGEYRARRPRARRGEEASADQEGGDAPSDERIAADSLPPAISAGDGGEEEAPRAPRRRTRRPRGPDEEIAPAA